ncbi:MAG: GDSL-type esterase/lipase family protein [Tannerella sp.]|jgi:lysophospholipase L1-like esterase|nr:GDSL-type esterase/lipase family protein [Tannerella sp.]
MGNGTRLLFLSILFALLMCRTNLSIAAEPDTIRIMPVGDSLTQSNEPGYRGYLYETLRQLKISFDFVGVKRDKKGEQEYDTDHSGFSGYTIGPGPSILDKHDKYRQGNILYHLDKGHCILSSKPDVILLMIGINDFFNNLDTARYNPNVAGAERLDNLIYHIYRILPETSVLVSNITPLRGDKHFADLYNNQVESIVSKYRKKGYICHFVDMRNGIDWDLETDLSVDNLHPASSGYQKIAANFYKVLASILSFGE